MKRQKLRREKTVRNPKNITKELRSAGISIELIDRKLSDSDHMLYNLFQNTEGYDKR